MPSKIFQPMMSDVKPTTYIKQGVVDNSEAQSIKGDTEFLKDAGGMAIDAYRGSEIARLERQHESTIDQYLAPRNDLIVAADLRKNIDTMWQKDGVSIDDINPLEQEFQNRLAKYKKAQEEGIMSPEEFQVRILKETREAVNRLPGLYPELMEHSKKVLGLSGINDIVKMDQMVAQNAAKAQNDAQKNLRELSDKLNVSYNYAQPNYAQMQADVHERQRQIRAVDTLDSISKKNAFVSKETAKQFVASDGTNFLIGDTLKVSQNFTQMFKDSKPGDYDSLITMLSQEVLSRQNKLAAIAHRTGIINEPDTQDLLKRHTESLNQLLTIAKNAGSGKNAAEAMQNAFARIESEQKLGFAKQYNVAALNALKLVPDNLWLKFDTNQKQVELMALTSGLVNMALDSPAMAKGLVTSTIKKDSVDAVSVAFGMFDNGGQAEFGKSVTTLRKAIIDAPVFKTEDEKFKAMDGFIRELKNPLRKGKYGDVGADTVGDAFKIADEYVQTSAKFMTKKAAEFGDVRAEVLPDGRLMFAGKNPEHVAFMNREYAARINDAIVGMANIMNVSTKEAAKLSYPRYKDIFTTQNQAFGDISLNIHNKDEAILALQQGKITGYQYDVMMKDYGTK